MENPIEQTQGEVQSVCVENKGSRTNLMAWNWFSFNAITTLLKHKSRAATCSVESRWFHENSVEFGEVQLYSIFCKRKPIFPLYFLSPKIERLETSCRASKRWAYLGLKFWAVVWTCRKVFHSFSETFEEDFIVKKVRKFDIMFEFKTLFLTAFLFFPEKTPIFRLLILVTRFSRRFLLSFLPSSIWAMS